MAMTISMIKPAYKLSNLTNNNYYHDNSAELIVKVATVTLTGTEAYDNYIIIVFLYLDLFLIARTYLKNVSIR